MAHLVTAAHGSLYPSMLNTHVASLVVEYAVSGYRSAHKEPFHFAADVILSLLRLDAAKNGIAHYLLFERRGEPLPALLRALYDVDSCHGPMLTMLDLLREACAASGRHTSVDSLSVPHLWLLTARVYIFAMDEPCARASAVQREYAAAAVEACRHALSLETGVAWHSDETLTMELAQQMLNANASCAASLHYAATVSARCLCVQALDDGESRPAFMTNCMAVLEILFHLSKPPASEAQRLRSMNTAAHVLRRIQGFIATFDAHVREQLRRHVLHVVSGCSPHERLALGGTVDAYFSSAPHPEPESPRASAPSLLAIAMRDVRCGA
ncbi:MAG: hypothetical protein EOO65_00215 [Methanosarcinales archaeon]|nr:MAG: hypothetical protein EOO65_00215 [Methanosarcinales archaeon]